MSTDTVTARVIKVYVEGDLSALDGLYTPSAVADVNVPQWRYQVNGAEDIERALREDELGVPGRLVPFWRVGTTDEGLYLETEVRFQGGDGEQMWRSLHLFRLHQGQIAEHTIYCSGIWSPADIARHQAANVPAHL